MPTSWPRLFSMVSGISPWPMAVVENGPRLRNNAMVIPFVKLMETRYPRSSLSIPLDFTLSACPHNQSMKFRNFTE